MLCKFVQIFCVMGATIKRITMPQKKNVTLVHDAPKIQSLPNFFCMPFNVRRNPRFLCGVWNTWIPKANYAVSLESLIPILSSSDLICKAEERNRSFVNHWALGASRPFVQIISRTQHS